MATAKRNSAIVSRRELAQSAPNVERIIGIFLLMLSLGGSVLWGGGGVDDWRSGSVFWPGAVAAALIQLGLSAIQWTHATDRWHSRWWLAALAVSSTLTILGYWPLAHETITAALIWATIPERTAPFFAGMLIIVIGVMMDYLPEQILTGSHAEPKESSDGK